MFKVSDSTVSHKSFSRRWAYNASTVNFKFNELVTVANFLLFHWFMERKRNCKKLGAINQ